MNAAQTRLKNVKEELFKWSMELEDVAEDMGYPHKTELLEHAAIIQEQIDAIEEMLPKKDDSDPHASDAAIIHA